PVCPPTPPSPPCPYTTPFRPAHRLGRGGVMLFGLPAAKDATGSEAYDEQEIVQQAPPASPRAPPAARSPARRTPRSRGSCSRRRDRKSTRPNSSHGSIPHAVF